MSLYAGLRPPRPTRCGRPRPFFSRYTPPFAPKTRSLRRPVEKDGSAAFARVLMRLALRPPFDTYSLPPWTNAISLQLPDTATPVAGCVGWAPLGRRRFTEPLRMRLRNASGWPLVSPATRFDAADRKPTQLGLVWKLPSIDGE